MGLFDGKAKQESAESEVMQKLEQVPHLDDLLASILNNNNEPWLFMGQNYYDVCTRKITIEPDVLEIKWSTFRTESNIGSDGKHYDKRVEDIHGQIAYSYTKSGYMPLHSYEYDNGKKEIDAQRMCCLWAMVVRKRMIAALPNCEFKSVKPTNNGAEFIYSVPRLAFKDWF